MQSGGVGGKVIKAGVPVRVKETINIGSKTTTARGSRYLTVKDYEHQVAAGILVVLEEDRDKQGNLKKVKIESTRYVKATLPSSTVFWDVKSGASRTSSCSMMKPTMHIGLDVMSQNRGGG